MAVWDPINEISCIPPSLKHRVRNYSDNQILSRDSLAYLLCWTNKWGERFISRGPFFGSAEWTSHLVYFSSIVYPKNSFSYEQYYYCMCKFHRESKKTGLLCHIVAVGSPPRNCHRGSNNNTTPSSSTHSSTNSSPKETPPNAIPQVRRVKQWSQLLNLKREFERYIYLINIIGIPFSPRTSPKLLFHTKSRVIESECFRFRWKPH